MTRRRAPDPPKDPGRCVHCGCTETNPCRFGRYLTCSWILPDADRKVCSKRECVQAEIDLLFAALEGRSAA